jgi:D-lactate dehydrogenase
MVVHKYDGALKAEHGTGRNMAPFVELEWGMEAAAIMRNIKEVFDPSSILNPGVLINNDPQAHLKNLKPLPQANDLIDKCIECGFCEVHCPSRNLTLTPRQRIVLYREIHRLDRTGEDPIAAENLEVDFQYDGNETCATDGLCATACPVNINTGALIKQLRFEKHSRAAHWIASMIAGHMSATTAAVRFGLNIVDRLHRILGSEMMTELSTIVRGMSGGLIPQWNRWMPRGADPIHGRDQKPAADAEIVVYFPSCINRSMGPARFDPESDSLTTRTQRLLTKAGFSLRIPGNCSKLCCGMAFDSKGFKSQGKMKADELNEALLSASEAGRHPVLVDMSPCLFRMRETLDKRIRLFDPSEFVLEYLVDRLDFKKLNRTVTLHSTCTAIKMNLPEKYRKVAELCAAVVVIPDDIECCGWAGDRGFTYPELNDSALERLPYHIPKNCHDGYSTSRTCEIGLSLHSGISYRSLLYLVDECTTAKTSQEQSNMTIGKIS